MVFAYELGFWTQHLIGNNQHLKHSHWLDGLPRRTNGVERVTHQGHTFPQGLDPPLKEGRKASLTGNPSPLVIIL